MKKAVDSGSKKQNKVSKPAESSNDDDYDGDEDETVSEDTSVLSMPIRDDNVARKMAARRRLEVLREEKELQYKLSEEFGW